MLNKLTIALATALTLGAASAASASPADIVFDTSGAPINMHLVDTQRQAGFNAFASTNANSVRAQSTISADETAWFNRASRPYDGE